MNPAAIMLATVLILATIALLASGLVALFNWSAARAEGRPRVNPLDRYEYGGYDEQPAPAAPIVASSSLPWSEGRQEEVAEEAPALRPGELVITEKALREQGRDAYEQGAVDVFAALVKGGYIDASQKGRLGKLKQVVDKLAHRHTALFGATGGSTLQRFNRLFNEVPVEPPPTPPVVAKPVSGNPRPPGATYSGEDRRPAAAPAAPAEELAEAH